MAHFKACRTCREMVPKVNKKGQCPTCALDRAAKVARQLHEKKGYYYYKWQRAMRKFGLEV